MLCLFLLSAAVFLAYLGTVHAQVSGYVVINPIDVCLASTNNGTVTKTCAPFGMNCTTQSNGGPGCGTAFNDPVAATSSQQSIATTPIGFVDAPTNINLTRAIWLPAGIDVVFLPIQEYDSPITCSAGPNCNTIPSAWCPTFNNGSKCSSTPPTSWSNTDYRTLHVATNITTNFPSPDFAALTAYTLPSTNPSTTVPICPSTSTACSPSLPPPLAVNTTSNAINMFFVNAIQDVSGLSSYNGYTWINGNGVAIANSTFSQLAFDVLAHEIGHALNLTHTSPGGQGGPAPGTSCTGTSYPSYSTSTGAQNGCNLMDAGVYPPSACVTTPCPFRVIPTTTGCLANFPQRNNPGFPFGGEQYDLDTMLCGKSAPPVTQADQILLGNSTNAQQGMALSSGLIVPTASVPATATAGGGKAAATTTTTTAATTTTTASTAASACPSPNSPITFTVNFPKFAQAGGRSQDEFMVALVLALPEGFDFGANPFCQIGTTPTVVGTQILNGNNGQGNTSCLKPINGAPSIRCLEILFAVPPATGVFTTNTTFSFTSDIVDKNIANSPPATIQELSANCPTPTGLVPLQCLDLTYVFSDLYAPTSAFVMSSSTALTANSRSPNVTVASAIVNPGDFPNLPSGYPPFTGFTQIHCTAKDDASCPPGTGPTGPD
jgi:hypothetical protein